MGTLTVQNLQGPTSGANANKVIIPSGQTLEVTDNIRYDDMPSGSVIQMQNAGIAGNSNTTTSTSFIDTGLSVNITPKFATSKILVIVHTVVSITNGASQARVDFRCLESGGTEIYRMDYHGTDGTQNGNIQKNMSGSGIFPCSNTNQLTFKTQVQKANETVGESGNIYYFWYTGSSHTITALEIAA